MIKKTLTPAGSVKAIVAGIPVQMPVATAEKVRRLQQLFKNQNKKP